MEYRKSTKTTEEKYILNCKNNEMLDLYLQLKVVVYDTLDDVSTAATADYISWSITGGRQFANFYIQKKKIRILTLEPMKKHSLGESVPDTHLWTLNYQTDIRSKDDIDVIKNIIYESYDRVN